MITLGIFIVVGAAFALQEWNHRRDINDLADAVIYLLLEKHPQRKI